MALRYRDTACIRAACVLALSLTICEASAAEPSQSNIQRAIRLANEGNTAKAIGELDKHLSSFPTDAEALSLRARLRGLARNHKAAIADFDQLIALATDTASSDDDAPDNSRSAIAIGRLYNARGASRFQNGDVAGSIQDFDEAIRRQPKLERSHWQRGISYYYTGEYNLGAKQFEMYQTYDAADVENVVWRFLCQAQAGGRTPAAIAKARADMLPLGAMDRRVPMMEIDSLFRGKGTIDAVFAAARADAPAPQTLHQRLFYAHLYVGLYHEVTNEPTAAREHLLAADKLRIEHYMWDVAHVHAERIED